MIKERVQMSLCYHLYSAVSQQKNSTTNFWLESVQAVSLKHFKNRGPIPSLNTTGQSANTEKMSSSNLLKVLKSASSTELFAHTLSSNTTLNSLLLESSDSIPENVVFNLRETTTTYSMRWLEKCQQLASLVFTSTIVQRNRTLLTEHTMLLKISCPSNGLIKEPAKASWKASN